MIWMVRWFFLLRVLMMAVQNILYVMRYSTYKRRCTTILFFSDRFSFSFEKWFAKFLSSKYLKVQLQQGLGTALKCLEQCECRHIAWDTKHKNWDRNVERFHPWKYEMRYTEKSWNFYQFREGSTLEECWKTDRHLHRHILIHCHYPQSNQRQCPNLYHPTMARKIQINWLQWRNIYK